MQTGQGEFQQDFDRMLRKLQETEVDPQNASEGDTNGATPSKDRATGAVESPLQKILASSATKDTPKPSMRFYEAEDVNDQDYVAGWDRKVQKVKQMLNHISSENPSLDDASLIFDSLQLNKQTETVEQDLGEPQASSQVKSEEESPQDIDSLLKQFSPQDTMLYKVLESGPAAGRESPGFTRNTVIAFCLSVLFAIAAFLLASRQ